MSDHEGSQVEVEFDLEDGLRFWAVAFRIFGVLGGGVLIVRGLINLGQVGSSADVGGILGAVAANQISSGVAGIISGLALGTLFSAVHRIRLGQSVIYAEMTTRMRRR